MTTANQLTLLRAFMAIALFMFILIPSPALRLLALPLFGIAALTDWLDGKIARETNTITTFGAIADPLVDKLLVVGAFIAFAAVKSLDVPHWCPFLIIVRELVVSGLRILAAAHGEVMAAERSGKFKTALQLISVILILIVLDFQTIAAMNTSYSEPATIAAQGLREMPYILSAAMTVITWWSGISYLCGHWNLLSRSWNKQPADKQHP